MQNREKFILQNESFSEYLSGDISDSLNEFYSEIPTLESELKRPIILLYDLKTKVFYIECHIKTAVFKGKDDPNATIDPDNQEDYKLNRDIQPQNYDFIVMKEDAKNGRQFSDIVVEYNKEYRPEIPLKILGGQHRSKAILDSSDEDRVHGFRIYFGLNKENRGEIARVSNTNIQISPDLLDRMDEQQLAPPNKLRDFAQEIGLLKPGLDFGDKKANKDNLPTINLMRVFIVNFYKGKQFIGDCDTETPRPYLSQPGYLDVEYKELYSKILSFKDEQDLLEAGKKYCELNAKQYEMCSKDNNLKKKKENKNKAMAMAVVSSWSFVAGLLQKDTQRLSKLYSLQSNCGKKDPLNSRAMSEFKLKDRDPETYRGLGARSGPNERGRLAKIFLEYSKSEKNILDSDILNRSVFHYEANRMYEEGDKFSS